MFSIRKGQYSVEFLVTYGWVLLIVIIAVGTLIYFDVFKIDKYLPDECIFGPNVICEDMSIQKVSELRFDLNLKLRNSLERSIEPVNFTLMNEDRSLVACNRLEVICPHTGEDANWSAAGYNSELTENGDSSWAVGMSCSLKAIDCEKDVLTTTKETFLATLGFRREGGANVYELNAKVMVRPIRV